MISYKEEQKIIRRGVILAFLHEANGQTASADMLLTVVKGSGVPSYFDEILEAVNWLDKKGYVATGGDSDVVLAEITNRGKRRARNEIRDEGLRLPDNGF